jgi:hypothetical protein
VQTWLAAAEISSGPVSGGGEGRTGVVRGPGARLSGPDREGVCPRRGGSGWTEPPTPLTAAQRLPHVGRRGGASVFKLSEVSRLKSLDTLRGYVRRVDLFNEHAGAAFL